MSDQTQQKSPEQRVSDLETAARLQSHMNEALSVCIDELYRMVRELTPEAVDGEPMQPLTGMALVRQMLEQQMNGNNKAGVDLEQIRKWNQERKDNKPQ